LFGRTEGCSFDFVHYSAVLDHVGSQKAQRFSSSVATAGTFSQIVGADRPDLFADERNLDLLSMRRLRRIAVHARVVDWHIDAVSLLGWPTKPLLWAYKPAAASARPPKQEHTVRVVSMPSQHCLAIIAADAWSQS